MEFNTAITYYKSQIGILEITGDDNSIHSIAFINKEPTNFSNVAPKELKKCIEQLHEYFTGNRKTFQLNLNPKGTAFQNKVWGELLQIPFGKTKNYLEQSKKIGNVKAIRAVAQANGKNPIAIIIPCHRVIGSNGSLTGYAGGLWRKKWLLNHEADNKQQCLF